MERNKLREFKKFVLRRVIKKIESYADRITDDGPFDITVTIPHFIGDFFVNPGKRTKFYETNPRILDQQNREAIRKLMQKPPRNPKVKGAPPQEGEPSLIRPQSRP